MSHELRTPLNAILGMPKGSKNKSLARSTQDSAKPCKRLSGAASICWS
ncbi:hypothetical protein [Stenomitos frigidus]|nr:hypothetical protein [Stenomitos frigidus]